VGSKIGMRKNHGNQNRGLLMFKYAIKNENGKFYDRAGFFGDGLEDAVLFDTVAEAEYCVENIRGNRKVLYATPCKIKERVVKVHYACYEVIDD